MLARVYMQQAQWRQAIQALQKKDMLKLASYVAVFLCVCIGVVSLIATLAQNSWLNSINAGFSLLLELVFAVAWMVALRSIQAKVKNTENLMPNHRIFFIHKVLL